MLDPFTSLLSDAGLRLNNLDDMEDKWVAQLAQGAPPIVYESIIEQEEILEDDSMTTDSSGSSRAPLGAHIAC